MRTANNGTFALLQRLSDAFWRGVVQANPSLVPQAGPAPMAAFGLAPNAINVQMQTVHQ